MRIRGLGGENVGEFRLEGFIQVFITAAAKLNALAICLAIAVCTKAPISDVANSHESGREDTECTATMLPIFIYTSKIRCVPRGLEIIGVCVCVCVCACMTKLGNEDDASVYCLNLLLP